MQVSIIIPAYNAAETITETLESLSAQTFQDWEAVVVNDGSTDQTAEIVKRMADQDSRFCLINQPNQGVAQARNTGIDQAHFDWLLFLDAVDWLLPQCLECLTKVLQAGRTLDAVYCDWKRVGPDGSPGQAQFVPPPANIFAALTRYNALAIHACLVRRSLALAVGGFDDAYPICEDWDFWQKVARLGAKFDHVPEVLVGDRIRPESISLSDGPQLLANGLQIIDQGHNPDPRLTNLDPAYANGMPRSQLSSARFSLACWAAGLMLGSYKKPDLLLESLKDDSASDLEAQPLANAIFQAALLPRALPGNGWDELWPNVRENLAQFLKGLEAQSQAPALALRIGRRLERLILDNTQASFPLRIGNTYGVRLDITKPIPDIQSPPAVERLYCLIDLAEEKLGAVELPICDGFVPGDILADTITAKYAWPILGRFFEDTLYPKLRLEQNPTGSSLWRGALCLVDDLQEDREETLWSQAYRKAGWTLFLQEIWDRPDWPKQNFYNRQLDKTSPSCCSYSNLPLTIEVSEDLPDIFTAGNEVEVIMTVGGATLGRTTLPVERNMMAAHQLQVALTQFSRFELCRLAVREGIIGRPLTAHASLRVRLAQRAKQHHADEAHLASDTNISLARDVIRTVQQALAPSEGGIILGRRYFRLPSISPALRACLPRAAAAELVAAAQQAGEPVIQISGSNDQPIQIRYAPDLISYSDLTQLVHNQDRPQPLLNPGRQAKQAVSTARLPILAYHRITPVDVLDQSSSESHYCVTPEKFEEQLQYLRAAGYHSINLEDWHRAIITRNPRPGRAILIIFEGGHPDFLTYAWPLLKEYGFSANIFPRVDEVNKASHDEEASSLTWEMLRQLRDEGVAFGSGGVHHRPLTALSVEEIVRQAARSRLILQRELRININAFAYPYGDVDPAIQHLIGACGYIFGLSPQQRLSHLYDSLLGLPSITIEGSNTLAQFVEKLDSDVSSEANYTKFVVLGQERTGSNLLLTLLGSHRNIIALGEVFNPNEELRKKVSKVLLSSKDDPVNYLETHVYKSYPDNIKAVGFKLFYTHARNRAWQRLRDYLGTPDIKIIHIKRKNLLDRYLSHQLALRSNEWISFDKKQDKYSQPVRLNPDDCIKDFERSLWYQREADEFFRYNPKIDVFYEDLAANPMAEGQKLLAFLGLDRQELSVKMVKQRTQKKSEVITNYDAVKQQLLLGISKGWAKEEWLDFFDQE